MRARDIITEDYRTAAARFVQQGAQREEVDALIARWWTGTRYATPSSGR
jgi:hypothetical protein